MYTPGEFRAPLELAQAFLQKHDFGVLVTVDRGVPSATHLPFLYRPEPRPLGTLTAHMARANPQWKAFSASEVLAVFQGPHAYVSPSWYSVHPSVPTWNYAVVHAYGVPRTIDDESAVRRVLAQLVAKYDPTWPMNLPEEFFARMVRQITAFEIGITRLEGKFKMSQNRSEEDRSSVERELARSEDPAARELARMMRAVKEGRIESPDDAAAR